jgi:SAM-dependent methyltransferase
LEKFTRWLGRRTGGAVLNPTAFVLDLGCGNGRNLNWLAKEFSVRGAGFDSSHEAIKQAVGAAPTPAVKFEVRSLNETLPLSDESADLVLDMMSSHVLEASEREKLREEIWRVLKPGGWFFFKSFLLEEDLHARRLLRDHPGREAHTYEHPELGVTEHVWTLDELEDFFLPRFEIHKVNKSHKHISRGRAFRRRTVSVYLQKREF